MSEIYLTRTPFPTQNARDLLGAPGNRDMSHDGLDYGNRLREVVIAERYEYDAHGRRVKSLGADGGLPRHQWKVRRKAWFKNVYERHASEIGCRHH